MFGAFGKITPAKDGLLHVIQICDRRVENVDDCLRMGDIVRVKIQEVDRDSGKISLTRKGLDFPEGDPILERLKNAPPSSRSSRPPQRSDRHSRSPSSRPRGDRDRRDGGRDRGRRDPKR